MTEDKNKRRPPPEIEILNPRYKGSTPENGDPCTLDKSCLVKYSSRMTAPESRCQPCRVLKKRYSGYSRQKEIIRTYIGQEVKIDEHQ